MMNSINDITQILKNDIDINFIGIAVTPLHVIGVEAAMLYLEKQGISLKGVKLGLAHDKTGLMVTEDMFRLKRDIAFYSFSLFYSQKRSLLDIYGNRLLNRKITRRRNEKRRIYLAVSELNFIYLPMIYEAYRDAEIVVLFIDDGAKGYQDLYINLKERMADSRGNINGLRNKRRLIKDYKNLTVMQTNLAENLINCRLFTADKDGLHINTVMAPFYRQVFEINCSRYDKSRENDFAGACLINTQCLSESYELDNDIDFDLYSEAAKTVSALGIRITLKPHPREKDVAKYKQLPVSLCEEKEVSQEIIFAALDKMPLCIIGIYSSTLINARGIFDIPAISLARIMLKRDICEPLRAQLEDYYDKYRNIIIFPENMDELKQHLLLLKNEI